MRKLLTETTPKKSWTESREECAARLKRCADCIKHNYDVEGLCKGLPQRIKGIIKQKGVACQSSWRRRFSCVNERDEKACVRHRPFCMLDDMSGATVPAKTALARRDLGPAQKSFKKRHGYACAAVCRARGAVENVAPSEAPGPLFFLVRLQHCNSSH